MGINIELHLLDDTSSSKIIMSVLISGERCLLLTSTKHNLALYRYTNENCFHVFYSAAATYLEVYFFHLFNTQSSYNEKHPKY